MSRPLRNADDGESKSRLSVSALLRDIVNKADYSTLLTPVPGRAGLRCQERPAPASGMKIVIMIGDGKVRRCADEVHRGVGEVRFLDIVDVSMPSRPGCVSTTL